MKVMVLGATGAAHALIWKLFASNRITDLVALPGNAGTGILVPAADNIEAVSDLVTWARSEGFDLIVPAIPELLAAGLADQAADLQLSVWGAPRRAAFLDGSRLWLREFLNRHNLPAPAGKAFLDLRTAERYLAGQELPINLWGDFPSEYDGAYTDRAAALQAISDIFALPPREGQLRGVVIETPAVGPTIALSAFTDGTTLCPLLPVRLYDRAEDGDTGWAAPGMGAHTADNSLLTRIGEYVQQQVLEPVFAALSKEQLPWWGVLGVDCAITAQGPRLLRIRTALAEAEAQVLMPRMEQDLFAWVAACQNGVLSQLPPLRWKGHASVGVTLVQEGYPHNVPLSGNLKGLEQLDGGLVVFQNETRAANSMAYIEVKVVAPEKRSLLSGLSSGFNSAWNDAFSAGSAEAMNETITTYGNRLATVVAVDDTLSAARQRVYANIGRLNALKSVYRTDIASREV